MSDLVVFLRARLGRTLRRLADRVDPAGAFRAVGMTFTYEANHGMRIHEDGRVGAARQGCALWYRGPDYARAFTDADAPTPRVDWASMTVQRPDPDMGFSCARCGSSGGLVVESGVGLVCAGRCAP